MATSLPIDQPVKVAVQRANISVAIGCPVTSCASDAICVSIEGAQVSAAIVGAAVRVPIEGAGIAIATC